MLHGHDADRFEKISLMPANYWCCRRLDASYKFLCCNFDDKIFPGFPVGKNVPRFCVKVIKRQQQHITMGQELLLLLFPLSSAEAFNCLTMLAAWILGPKCRASPEESVLFLLYE